MSRERLQAYIEKLYSASEVIEKRLQKDEADQPKVRKLSGTDFEEIVYNSLLEVGLNKENITHSTQKFPDFVIHDFTDGTKLGVEVKKTDTSRWEVIGGSIYESLKNEIEDTYVLMAKMGGEKAEVKLRRYEECIADLKVTHSPRFYLNLDLEAGEDYLTKNDAKDLLELSGEALNKKIRRLLRTQKSTWWSEGEIIAFSDLSKEEKNTYLNEGIALFPEVFGSNYQKFTPWLVYSCFVWCGNVRDIFSAGGNVYDEELHIYISAIMHRTLCNVSSIKQRILDMTDDEQIKFWGKIADNSADRLKNWLQLVENNLKCSSDLIKNNQSLSGYDNYEEERISSSVKSIFLSRLEKNINE